MTADVETDGDPITPQVLRDAWPVLSPEDRVVGFFSLPRGEAGEFFLELTPRSQAQIIRGAPAGERRLWIRLLAPDDAADVLQEVSPEERGALFELLDDVTRREVAALLAYAEDAAGGLMSPRFARVRPDATVDEALLYLRRQAREWFETISYVYALDSEQRLAGVVSVRQILAAPPEKRIQDVMTPREKVIAVPETLDQEAVARLFSRHGFLALPVVDEVGRMQGVLTLDDIVDVVQEEATEDVQKFGGMEALERPYLQTPFLPMIRKRAGWLSILFVGEMLTASAMGHYEDEIARAVVLALFIPLIISSGGNSGSQASTLVIRAMALGEVKLRDWWRIMRRELSAGLVLGGILAAIGFARILLWQALFQSYGAHSESVAFAVGASLVGVVVWGTFAGSMLPFLLRRLGFDPASASAPFVATLVDVSGLVIYFTVAELILGGKLL